MIYTVCYNLCIAYKKGLINILGGITMINRISIGGILYIIKYLSQILMDIKSFILSKICFLQNNGFVFLKMRFYNSLFLFFVVSASISFNTAIAGSDTESEDDGVDAITKGIGRLPQTVSAARPAQNFDLARFDGTTLLAEYTDQLTLSSTKVFNLVRPTSKKHTTIVDKLSRSDKFRSHLLAQGICYHAKGIEENVLTTDLGFPSITSDVTLSIDWISHSSSSKTDKSYYRQKTNPSIDGGHSEPQFINDFDALWKKNYSAILSLLLPSSVFHGTQDVYMTGLELFGPFDMCDQHNSKYDCLDLLIQFTKRQQQGQQSISQALQDLLKMRFKGTASEGFVLLYHAAAPYDSIGTYNPVGGSVLEWDYKSIPSRFKTKKGYVSGDTLSQYNSVTPTQDVIYGHIHSLTNKTLKYNDRSSSFQ
jgi:hypothetical protein